MRYWRTSLPYDFIMVFLVIIQKKKKFGSFLLGCYKNNPEKQSTSLERRFLNLITMFHPLFLQTFVSMWVQKDEMRVGFFCSFMREREREINKILNYKEKSKKKLSKRRFSLFSFLMTKYAMKDAQKDHQSKTLMVWTFFLNKKYIPQGLYLQFCPICYHTLIYFSRFV